MLTGIMFVRRLAVVAPVVMLAVPVSGDKLRLVDRGQPVPAYHMPTIDGTVIESQTLKGTVVVLVCLSAQQRRSELAAVESFNAWKQLGDDQVKLIHITADVIQKSYFEAFRKDHGISAPLAFDVDRVLFGQLGMIVMPTTIVIDAEGQLAHVISLHRSSYEHTLDSYIRHTLGQLNDEELERSLEVGASGNGSTKSLASAHRALARSMRDKGQIDTARSELIKAREQEPDNHEVILDLADLEITLGDYDSADELVEIVLKGQPNHRRAQQVKGITCFKRGQIHEAEQFLKQALKFNPNPERVHYYLGQICERNGEIEQALEHYRQALQQTLNEPD